MQHAGVQAKLALNMVELLRTDVGFIVFRTSLLCKGVFADTMMCPFQQFLSLIKEIFPNSLLFRNPYTQATFAHYISWRTAWRHVREEVQQPLMRLFKSVILFQSS